MEAMAHRKRCFLMIYLALASWDERPNPNALVREFFYATETRATNRGKFDRKFSQVQKI